MIKAIIREIKNLKIGKTIIMPSFSKFHLKLPLRLINFITFYFIRQYQFIPNNIQKRPPIKRPYVFN